jgi:hypothetical protein
MREHLDWIHQSTAVTVFAFTRLFKFAQWILQGRYELIGATLEGWRDFAARRVGQRQQVQGK